jgi:hypothetical protein
MEKVNKNIITDIPHKKTDNKINYLHRKKDYTKEKFLISELFEDFNMSHIMKENSELEHILEKYSNMQCAKSSYLKISLSISRDKEKKPISKQ